jgi:uncharacterized protein YqeY
MGIKEQIIEDIKISMKARESDKVNALRFLQSAMKNREIEVRPNVATEEDYMAVVKKSVKQRKESIEQYQNAGRQDLVDAETKELKIIEAYLPTMLSEEKVTELVEQAIAELGAKTVKEMGAVIKKVQALSEGQADNRLVSEKVKARLQ